MTPEPPYRGRFFGRTKGKTIRQRQSALLGEALPRLLVQAGEEPIDIAALFPFDAVAFRLEIGFGGGEHLAHRAQESPTVGFIGVEPFVNGMAKLLSEVHRLDLRNIRVFDQDATLLLRRLPEGSIDWIDLLYPDPWPKRRQRKRRFVSAESLSLIGRVLRRGGGFRFASDIDDYVGWTLSRALDEPSLRWRAEAAPDWTAPYPGWPGTRYEAKAFREGRKPSYLTFDRV